MSVYMPVKSLKNHYYCNGDKNLNTSLWASRKIIIVAYFARQVNPGLAKPPLKFNGDLANAGLASLL